MIDTCQEIPGALQSSTGRPSNWQSGIPESLPTPDELSLIRQHANKQAAMIEEVYGGPGGQLSIAARHLASRGT